ncbi:hypothetical protein Syun_026363 [Stephania yunnanensis]|uniref:Uncharacterized protein n=1 Tax=Stephania yunnanensis TaxID=152371 RepID=A0AAP0EYX9_9MAGN
MANSIISSIFRHRTAPPILLNSISISISAAHRQNLTNPNKKHHHLNQTNKNLLKARQSVKHLSSLAPFLSPSNPPPLTRPDQAVGTVAAAQANFMRVIVESAPAPAPAAVRDDDARARARAGVELLCVVKAVLKKIKRRVLVGDRVMVGAVDWVDGRGMIENVFQRTSEVADPPVANVDHLLVLFSMDQPKVEAFTLTRFLVEAESAGMPLTLAFNKAELVDDETRKAWKIKLREWGYQPLFCSVETGNGLDSLAYILKGQTSVIVGPSGVGKSSLINALRSAQDISAVAYEDSWFTRVEGTRWYEDQRVGEVSSKSGKGKHTTRHVSLLPLTGGGYLADTPGFNQPSLLKVTKKTLPQMFPEIRKMLSESDPSKCAFNDCMHLGEPGCVVKADWERYPYYLQLFDEIKIREEFQLRTIGTKREGDVRYKVGDMGVKQAEPRLEFKKHRRQSRKRINQSILDELDDDEYFTDNEDINLEEDAKVVGRENQ